VIRRLLGLAVFLLIAHAAVRASIVWFHYQNFKDGVREVALFAGTKTDDALRDQVAQLAQQNSVPLDPDAVTIDRAGGGLTIRASYTATVELVPRYPRRWRFEVVGR
jgi:hypothetical protein